MVWDSKVSYKQASTFMYHILQKQLFNTCYPITSSKVCSELPEHTPPLFCSHSVLWPISQDLIQQRELLLQIARQSLCKVDMISAWIFIADTGQEQPGALLGCGRQRSFLHIPAFCRHFNSMTHYITGSCEFHQFPSPKFHLANNVSANFGMVYTTFLPESDNTTPHTSHHMAGVMSWLVLCHSWMISSSSCVLHIGCIARPFFLHSTPVFTVKEKQELQNYVSITGSHVCQKVSNLDFR